ncbi:vWA domain-containing protein [Deinococcus aerophilus]|uniref:VWA domain-containing protein n=1 Tax=Deinococcus aerophilus TaxID=522488 RepID=A0ABQ2GSL8_9DEIO|nr:VWA domain-containing protein [Deinococcus aerophilus]GGM09932.1 VWA domain-containing protein [Deinococcus aerophilus]
MSEPVPANLAARITAFAARLRTRHGFLIGPGEAADALRAAGAVELLDRRQLRDALRAVLTDRPEQTRSFDHEFNVFFRRDGEPPPPELPPLLSETGAPGAEQDPAATPRPPQGQEGQVPTPAPPQTGEEPELVPAPAKPQGKAADHPDDADGDLQTVQTRLSPNAGAGGAVHTAADDLNELLRAASALIRVVELGQARRLRPMARGPKLDARRTLRAAARTAGDPAALRWLGRPRRAPRFLLVLDGSRSMGKDATLLLRFAQALHLRSRRVEVYAFSTGLTRLTPHLRRTRPGQPLALPDLGEAWGGGTRIGENLLQLARQERERVNRDTVVLILSDGLDTGEVEVLERALRDLKRRAGRVVWLSPLAALPGYQPVQRAIRAALPHLDALLPAGGMDDLLRLGARLHRS